MDYLKREEGISLIEVMAALVLLSLSAITLLSVFTTASQWIRVGGDRTIVAQYANSIIESTIAQSSDLAGLEFPASGVIEVSDSNELDDEFNFSLEPAGMEMSALDIYAPASDLIAEATLKISPHDELSYYPDENGDGKVDISLPFGENLFNIDVVIKWQERGHSRSFGISTIVGAK